MRRAWRWISRVLGAIAFLVLLAAVAVGALLGPYLVDDLRLDRTARFVAQDWRDFGRDRAWERLQYELDHQHVGLQVSDDSCELAEVGADRVVRCHWRGVVVVPFTGWTWPLYFQSRATLGPDGEVR